MIFKYRSAFPLLLGIYLIAGCMDISPPSKVDVNTEEILHSIRLPFASAVYGIGAIDTLLVTGVLVTGDTIHIEPADIKWRVSRVTDAIHIDSLGVLQAFRSSAAAIRVYAAYKLGETTRETSVDVFITDDSYDIETFKVHSLDSARTGALTNAYLILGVLGGERFNFPQLKLDIADINGVIPSQISLNSLMHVNPFVTSATTGKAVVAAKRLSFFDPFLYPKGLYVNGGGQPGDYWLGLKAYIYKKHLRDSILFTQLRSAELYFVSSQSASGAISVHNFVSTVQPCALVVFNNPTRDTISVELPPPEIECEGGLRSPGDRIVIPPSTAMKLRSLGYRDGTNAEWKAFVGSTSEKPIASGVVRSQQ